MFAFRDYFIIYFYICGVKTDSLEDMQTLLNDIELDIQELKCLMQVISTDANPALRTVAKRNIQQMRTRLDELQTLLDGNADNHVASISTNAPVNGAPVNGAPVNEVPFNEVPVNGVSVNEASLNGVKTAPQVVTEPVVKNIFVKPAGRVEKVDDAPVRCPITNNQPSAILAERIKPSASLNRAISLNDSFRFTREIFNGNAARMNDVVRRLGEAGSFDKALALFHSEVDADEENEAVSDFIELLKKYFS